MLAAPDPWADGREVKVVDLLERASLKLDETLGDQPEVAAQAHHRLGYTYRSLGLYDEAERHLKRAMEISDQLVDFPLEAQVDFGSAAPIIMPNGKITRRFMRSRELYCYKDKGSKLE